MNKMFKGCSNFNQDLSGWNIQSLINADEMLNDASINIFNYTELLVGWANNMLIQTDVSFGANNCYYLYEGIAPHNKLINDYNWQIDDLGPYPQFPPSMPLTNWGGMFINNIGQSQNFLLESFPEPIPGLELYPSSSFYHYDASGVTDMSKMFFDCSNIIGYGIGKWNVETVTNFDYMLNGCANFNQDISNWNTRSGTSFNRTFFRCSSWSGAGAKNLDLSGATTMFEMFSGCSNFDEDLTLWSDKVDNISNFARMFKFCENFTGIGLDTWTTNNARTFFGLFNNCNNFNQDLSGWNVSNVINFSYMFRNNYKFEGNGIQYWRPSSIHSAIKMFNDALVFNVDLSNWAEDMSNCSFCDEMFTNCISFIGQGLPIWNVSHVKIMNNMFRNCTLFNQDLSDWDISNLTSAQSMLDDCGMSTQNFTLLLRNWGEKVNINRNVSFGALNLQYYQWARPNGPSSPLKLDVSYNWNIIGATENTVQIGVPPSMSTLSSWSYMFYDGIGDSYLGPRPLYKDIQSYQINLDSEFYWNLPTQLTDLFKMFTNCSNFLGKGLETWNTENIITMQGFLENCSTFQQDLSGWDLSNIIEAETIFKNCSQWDGEGSQYWNLTSATSTTSLFEGCSNFNQDLSGWSSDMGNVENMDSMFENCTSFTGEGLDRWNTTMVSSMQGTFKNCSNFDQNISYWNISNLQHADNMLDNCGMSTENFSQLLANWSYPSPLNGYYVPSDIILGAAGLKFENYAAGNYKFLTTTYNWTITCSGQVELPIPEDIQLLTDWSKLFYNGYGTYLYQSIIGIQLWPTTDFLLWREYSKNVTNFTSMFELDITLDRIDTTNFTGLGLETWKLDNAINMNSIFKGCSNFVENLSNWDVSNIQFFNSMFTDCSNFQGTGLNNWNTKSANSFFAMFENCTNFNQDISGWDITNLTNAGNMLNNCGMSPENYSQLLIGWASQSPTFPLVFGVQGMQYHSRAYQARTYLDTVAGWTFDGDSMIP